MTVEEYAANGYEPYAPAQTPTADAPQQGDTFTIYQLKGGDETRDFRFEPYDRLQAAGLAVDPANYEQTYTAPLAPDMTLDSIFERFNIDRPADFTGHSLSVSDVVVLHQNGQDTAHYVSDLADAIKSDKERGGKTPKSRSSKKPEQKPSIRAQLAAAKEQAKQQPTKQPDKSKSKEAERG